MRLSDRYSAILSYFQENVPVAVSELNFENPYQLLVAVMLSAQCTDKRVNMVTPSLFRAFPDPKSLSEAGADGILPYVKSVSYPNSKASHLASAASVICSRFNGEIPSGIDDLMSLPGVGRKTANVVASIIYNEPVIAVDTHVFRVSRRLGLSRGTSPRAVEIDLEKNIPAQLRPIAHHWLILHGRYVCTARKPMCEKCGLAEFCKSAPKTGLVDNPQ